MSKFSFDRKFIKNAGFSATSALCMQGALVFVLYPYLSRHLGDERFGYFLLVLSVTNFVLPVLTGAFANSLLRQHRDIASSDKAGFWLTGNVLVFVAGLLIGLMLIKLAGPLSVRWSVPQLAVWLPALIPSMILTMVYYTQRSQLIARLAYNRMIFFDILYGLGLLAIVPGCHLGLLGDYWPLFFTIAPLLALGGSIPYLVRQKDFSTKGAGAQSARLIMGPMSIYLIGLINVYLMRMADRWILGEVGLPGEQIAYYAVAVQAAFLALFPFEHISSVLLANFSNAKTLDEIEAKQLRRYFFALFFSMLLLGFGGSLVGYLYIRIFYEPAYLTVGLPIYLVTIWAMVIYLFQMFGRGIMVRFRHPFTDPIIQSIFGISSLALAWLLFQHLGLMGVAVGRNLGFIGVGVTYFFVCEWGLFKRAFLKKR